MTICKSRHPEAPQPADAIPPAPMRSVTAIANESADSPAILGEPLDDMRPYETRRTGDERCRQLPLGREGKVRDVHACLATLPTRNQCGSQLDLASHHSDREAAQPWRGRRATHIAHFLSGGV